MSSPTSPLDAWMAWPRMVSSLLAPTVSQPILPGWTFANTVNVTETNSSAPDVEHAVVSQQSYGRQLGRVIDALAAVIEQTPGHDASEPMQALLDLRATIDGIKRKTVEGRIEATRAWIAAAKQHNPDDFQRIAEALKPLLD